MKILIIGGGAAGIFAAITAAEKNPGLQVFVAEKGQLLSKVRISGGGRCNVTHSCFDPKVLVKNYPRGEKQLLGPFTRFQPQDTIRWFEQRGVPLKTEEDGRMFPITDRSETIIECLLGECRRLGVTILSHARVESIQKAENSFYVLFNDGSTQSYDKIVLTTGGTTQGYALAHSLGHTTVPSVPSLFTFNVPTSPLLELSGISVEKATLSLEGSSLKQTGPLLLTHWGFSGPAALKLSAWAARFLHEKEYHAVLRIQWIPDLNLEAIITQLNEIKQSKPTSTVGSLNAFDFPKKLWKKFLDVLELDSEQKLAQFSRKDLLRLGEKLYQDRYQIEGKTTYKQEFVTAGGVALNEVNFKTMESKVCPGLYFAGEILDIDGVTGGFNFQNAWTTGWIVGEALKDFNTE